MTFSRPPLQLSFEFDEASQAATPNLAVAPPVDVRAVAAASQVVSLKSFRLKKELTEKISLHRQILETISHMA
ncbi:hypothetical protein [Caballeronia sp. GaOx3]|uniref:hypothetical protein n=1 Tax=Caballeronia sp. GaOx3 TaxID=2921740 RepID=UPI00202859DC|nr:hypothetical protein [Caballeronia sp. GaOx3]